MLRLISLFGLLAVAGLAQAADNGFYVGVGAAQSEYGLDNPDDAQPFDDKDNGYKAIVGFRILDSFGVEANYIDHGNATLPAGAACIQLVGVPCPATTDLEAKTLSAFAVGFLDFPLIDLFAKAGGTSWKFDGSSTGFSFDDDDVEFAWGVGAQAHFGSLGARLEYENFSVIEDEELGTISLSFIYTFL
jgi:outer membrane protein with beta-barrel domain